LAGRGNLNCYILDCFVVKLLAMTPKTQLIRREWSRVGNAFAIVERLDSRPVSDINDEKGKDQIGKDVKMKGLIQKALVLAIGVVVMVGIGCHAGETPSTKKARLIASENMQLKKQLERRDSEIEKLKTEHDRQIKLREEQIAKCLEQKQTLQKRSRENIQEQVDEVLATVVEENARLQEEIGELKAQIEELKN